MESLAKNYPSSDVHYPSNADIIPIPSIQVEERGRKDLGDIESLADSIKELGLIQPVVLNQDSILIAGERRLRAHELLGLSHIAYVLRETLAPSALVALELEENLQRKAMKWQEDCLLICKVHKLKLREASSDELTLRDLAILESSGGKAWGQKQTGMLMSVSHGQVSEALRVGRALAQQDEEVLASTSIQAAINILIERREKEICADIISSSGIPAPAPVTPPSSATADSGFVGPVGGAGLNFLASSAPVAEADTKVEGEIPSIHLSNSFLNQDCKEFLSGTPDMSFDHIITDPPYAIAMDHLEDNVGVNDDIKSTHKVEENLELLAWFIPQAFRVLRDRGFMFLWCDPMHFRTLHDWGVAAGFKAQRWPLVWHKLSPCKNSAAQFNTTKDYEICIKFRKGTAALNDAGPSSIITTDNPDAKMYDNPFAKPFKVWEWLINMSCQRDQTVLDPFAGNFSFARAAINLGINPVSVEVSPTHYNKGLVDIQAYYRSVFQSDVNFT